VIASAIPSVSATFVQGAGVAFVPPDDPSALAQGLLALLNDPDSQARMSTIGRQYVEQRFSWTHLTDRLREWVVTEKASMHHAHSRVL
jgi:glycosyltransferase involved in cell wall biosynthesis